MLLMTSLAITAFHEQISATLFADNDAVDAPVGASADSIAAGDLASWGG